MKAVTNFTVFSAIGVVFYIVAVAVNGFFIERMHLPAFWVATGSLFFLFVLKYLVSVKLGVIHRAFLRYTMGNLALSVLSAVLIWVSVDYLHLNAALSTAVVLLGIFVLRWFVLAAMGVINVSSNHATAHPGPGGPTNDASLNNTP